ncbi:MAG TPA: hypothetical protein VFO85_17930 [Vicinamibacteria bacterium]|nr:hypothetical protein [Vicinamibacteria bacterium]
MIALLCAAFATYRLAILLAEEEGPFEIAQQWRNLRTADDWIGRGLRCPACLSFWIAMPMTAAAVWVDAWLFAPAWPLYWLAVAGAACWLWRLEPR